MKFSAQFFDRQFQQQAAVEVAFRSQSLVILFPQENRTESWIFTDIETATEHDGQVILQRGKQFLEIRDARFRSAFERQFPQSKVFRQRGFFDKIGLAGCLLAVVLFVLPAVAFYFWGVPALADRAAKEVSPQVEKEIGDKIYQSFTHDFKVDESKTQIVQAFFDSLYFGNDYHFRLTVVQENQINAFAVPGGRIVVNSGILDLMDSPEELAALLGHEASHVLLKHSVRSIFRELGNSMVISLLFGDYGDAVGMVANQADELRGLAYSRELETEADENGLKLMLAAGVPPRGIVHLFEKMQDKLSGSHTEDKVSNFLSTHPSMSERLENMRKKIAEIPDAPTETSPILQDLFVKLKN